MADFYTKTNENGMVEGPFSTKQLKILAGKGTFRPEHLVSVDGGETWHPARMLVGLEFPTVARTPQTTPADPQPQSVVPHLGLAKKSGKKRYIAFAIVAVSAIGGFWLTSATPDSPNAIDKGARLRAFENKLDELRASAAQKRTEAQAVEAVPSSTSPPPNTKPGDSSTEPSTSSKTAEETIAATDNNTETAVTADFTVAKRGKRKTRSATRLAEKPVVLLRLSKFYPNGTEPVTSDNPAVEVLQKYFAVTAWEDRLPLVHKPKQARSLMEGRYGDGSGDSDDEFAAGQRNTTVHTVIGPARELRIGESALFKLTVFTKTPESHPLLNSSRETSLGYRIVRTADGYKIDWLGFFRHLKKISGHIPWGKIAKDDSIPEVTFKKLNIVGERYRGKHIKMLRLKFYELNNNRVDNLPSVRISTDGLLVTIKTAEYAKWFGFSAEDHEGESCYGNLLAMKAKWIDTFLEMKRDQLLNISGYVVELANVSGYGIVIKDVEVLDPTEY